MEKNDQPEVGMSERALCFEERRTKIGYLCLVRRVVE